MVFAKLSHVDKIQSIIEDFYQNYKPEFPIHPKLEKAQSTLIAVIQEVFSQLRTNFEDRKKSCDHFEHKEKKHLGEIDKVKAARVADLEELVTLHKDSRKTKDHLTLYIKSLRTLLLNTRPYVRAPKKERTIRGKRTGSAHSKTRAWRRR